MSFRIFAASSGPICCRRSMLFMIHCTSLLTAEGNTGAACGADKATWSPADSIAHEHHLGRARHHCIDRTTSGWKWPLCGCGHGCGHPLLSVSMAVELLSCTAVAVKEVLAATHVEVSPGAPVSPGTVGKTRRDLATQD